MILCLSSHLLIQRRAIWPATKGSNNCITIFMMDSNEPLLWPCATTSSPTRTGVRNMPSRLEADALQTAAGTLPRATEVKAIDDCTVDGKVHRNKMPRYRSGVTSGSNAGLNNSPSNGNNTKVASNTVKCRRQCSAPCTTASRDSLAPCRKNSKPIASVVIKLKDTATWPLAGNRLATRTVVTNNNVKLSGKKRGRTMIEETCAKVERVSRRFPRHRQPSQRSGKRRDWPNLNGIDRRDNNLHFTH